MKVDPKLQMWAFMKSIDIRSEKEYKFLEDRKFKFDFAIPHLKIGVEYEGLISNKSRHTTLTGYSKDCEKYNLAQINGWTVLRYTVLNYSNFFNDIKKIHEHKTERIKDH